MGLLGGVGAMAQVLCGAQAHACGAARAHAHSSSKLRCCPFCGFEFGSGTRLQHLTQHTTAAIRHVERMGGKPSVPPRVPRAPCHLEAEWPTTFNEQTQAFDDTPELQELECHANLYGLQRENGWFVYDGQLEHELERPTAEPHHSAAAGERDQKLMEAMVLCPPKYL